MLIHNSDYIITFALFFITLKNVARVHVPVISFRKADEVNAWARVLPSVFQPQPLSMFSPHQNVWKFQNNIL